MSDKRVIIVGAGMSGLVAALELERAGYRPVLIDAADRVGGRLQTDWKDGMPLDHGFQVLLTGYEAVQRYLDLEALQLRYFEPGAYIFSQQKRYTIGDPRRQLDLLWPTLTAPVGSIKDKWNIWRLSNALRATTVHDIFSTPEVTTSEWLKNYGFSERIINTFFRPFYGGIFLEKALTTSSRMFQFVFKMFAKGRAAIPAKGIGMVPHQLKAHLHNTSFKFHAPVTAAQPDYVQLACGETLHGDAVLLAADPAQVLPNHHLSPVDWTSTINMYFQVPASTFQRPMIGLVAQPDSVVNNIYFVHDLEESVHPLLSVSIVDDLELDEEALQQRVELELANYCGISGVQHLVTYRIPRALPIRNSVQYAPSAKEVTLGEGLFTAGDHLANGSLNAAMLSGRVAAEAIIAYLREK